MKLVVYSPNNVAYKKVEELAKMIYDLVNADDLFVSKDKLSVAKVSALVKRGAMVVSVKKDDIDFEGTVPSDKVITHIKEWYLNTK